MAISSMPKPLTAQLGNRPTPLYFGLFIAGVLMGLWPLWPLAWVALVLLWCVIHQEAGLQRSAVSALIWGVGYQGTMLTWILHLHPMMWLGIPWLGSIAIALFAYTFVTLWGAGIAVAWAVAMAALQKFSPLGPVARVLIGTVLWCAVEAIWSISPLYWTSLAMTQSPGNLAILHLARLSGHLTITAAIVAVNGLLAAALTRPRARPWLGAAVGIFAIAHLTGWGLYQQPLQDASAQAIKIGIIQGNIPSREKLTFAGIRRADDRYLSGYRQLVAAGADAVLTPEAAIPKQWNPNTSLFKTAVEQTGIPLWLGTFTKTNDRSNHLHQSLLAIAPTGISQYNKIKLVPLGEYIPLEAVLGEFISKLSSIGSSLLPGSLNQRFDTPFGQAAVGICYDSAYGWIFRHQVAQGGEFILTASNNDPYPPRMMAQHHGQDVIQAIATDRWAARSTNTGLSSVVDPHGHTQWKSIPQTFATQIETIYRRQTQTPYVRWGNWLVPLGLVISLGWLSLRPRPDP
ncbi:apolipoprotein N-acyltransferase [Leptothoe kymatousa]|uniref:Apolipoprotein N-acyltransferase n=1 Tax=Leptothoe kymatousa TAU-MAC 1615 TaxID=2364775 RepID=A0ABS5Y108_9CYAN|nr:apolipoprotein N-acyltransferase [Leptothoe kymatousa]MBT9310690.1 apolipoprotein N-acyltransferase [Leptothoe kymatousa TAU-MAC 1615]